METINIICVRVVDLEGNPVPGSTLNWCSQCKDSIWVDPINGKGNLLCWQCARLKIAEEGPEHTHIDLPEEVRDAVAELLGIDEEAMSDLVEKAQKLLLEPLEC